MKTVLSLIAFVVIVSSVSAQSNNDYMEMSREVLKMEKKAAIMQNLTLTEAEATPFWELYDEYTSTLYKVHNKRIAIINDFAENIDSLSNEKADEIWVSYSKYQQEVLKIKASYYKKFKKIVPAGKAARFFQIENKIEVLIDASLAMEIPLIETE